jgi:hypothetical protein
MLSVILFIVMLSVNMLIDTFLIAMLSVVRCYFLVIHYANQHNGYQRTPQYNPSFTQKNGKALYMLCYAES